MLSVLIGQLIVSFLPLEGKADWAGRVTPTQPIALSRSLELVSHALIYAGTTLLICYWTFRFYVHIVEQRNMTELTSDHALKELGYGICLGTLLSAATISVLAIFDVYHVHNINGWLTLIFPLLSAMISAFVEEVMFRGILFQVLEDSIGTWLALLISAVLFGGLHMANPDATMTSVLAIIVTAGVFLAIAFILTRHLWLPIGIHFAWNFTQEGIFGTTDAQALLEANLSGPTWLSGGNYGPEASVVTVLLFWIIGSYFTLQVFKKNQIKQPFWQQSSNSNMEV